MYCTLECSLSILKTTLGGFIFLPQYENKFIYLSKFEAQVKDLTDSLCLQCFQVLDKDEVDRESTQDHIGQCV